MLPAVLVGSCAMLGLLVITALGGRAVALEGTQIPERESVAATGSALSRARTVMTASTTTLVVLPEAVGDIVEKPNSGRPPEDPGDPGGWLQLMLFWLILAAVGLVVLLAWRDSRRKRSSGGRD